VEVDKLRLLTRVKITSIETTKKVKFELPVTEISQVEIAIAQKVQLSREEVRKVTNYAIVSPK
jgi:hypothetical protein